MGRLRSNFPSSSDPVFSITAELPSYTVTVALFKNPVPFLAYTKPSTLADCASMNMGLRKNKRAIAPIIFLMIKILWLKCV